MNVQFAGVGESSYLVRRVYVQGVLEPPARDALVDFSSGGHATGRARRWNPVDSWS